VTSGRAADASHRGLDRAILARLMLAFDGFELPPGVARRLAEAPAAGMTVFRYVNVETPAQLRALTEAVQAAAAPQGASPARPLLVGADQEGGQLIALGDGSTPFPGNMALGAIDDVALTERVGRAIGLEARAMGVNVVYAPCLDLASHPANPALGIRAFGDDPGLVARHGVAMVRGLQGAGVAAAVKHAPGMGAIAVDTHHGLAVVDRSRDELDAADIAPFRAAFEAGARMAMSGHMVLPSVTGRDDLPATLSRAVQTGLLRGDLGFDGVLISDALDMAALEQGPAQVLDVVAAVRAGIDLLLASFDPAALARIEDALRRAAHRELFDADEVAASAARVDALRAWLGQQGPAPALDVVRSAEHEALAQEVAARSITLAGDPGGSLPLAPGRRVVAVMPQPADLTPADTSSTIAPALAVALRRYHPDVTELVLPQRPTDADVAAVRDRLAGAEVAVLGLIDAHRQPEQLALVEAAAGLGLPVIAVALRGPWDLGDVADRAPAAARSATYSILPGSLDALAAVLHGEAEAPGRLPVSLGTPTGA
jgi:beta-N-acetylhexosaminidase